MSDDQRTIALQQLANIVIDAYINRDQQFVPEFTSGTTGVMYMSRPEDGKDDPRMVLGFWYERADYEPEGHS